MDQAQLTVGVRETKSQFSTLTAQVNETGRPLVVTKNNEPWVVVHPADAASRERRERRQRFQELTEKIEADAVHESSWDFEVSDCELLNAERVSRFG